jgi:uncharacterized protein (TIGR02594 family)
MHPLIRQLGGLLDDHRGFRNALAAGVVTTAIAGLMLTAQFDPVIRTFPPHLGAKFQELPVTPAKPVSAAVATERRPVTIPERAPESVASEQAPVRITAAPMSVPMPIARPARPEDVAEHATQQPPRTGSYRQSHGQVARNARNERRLRDAAANSGRYGASAYALIVEARRHIGTNPTSRARLWCARFMNYVLRRSGYRGTGSDMAMSFAHYGRRVSGPRVGAIAVLSRRGGGHVGIVTGVPGKGRIRLISGNDGRSVRERVRSTRSVIAYVMPRR